MILRRIGEIFRALLGRWAEPVDRCAMGPNGFGENSHHPSIHAHGYLQALGGQVQEHKQAVYGDPKIDLIT